MPIAEVKEAIVKEPEVKIYSSMDDIEESGKYDVEYALIDGFKPGEKFRIASLTAGDILEWTEASEDAKRTMGLRLICRSLVGPEPANERYANNDKYLAAFRKRSHKVMESILKAVLKLNGMEVNKAGTATQAEDRAKKD